MKIASLLNSDTRRKNLYRNEKKRKVLLREYEARGVEQLIKAVSSGNISHLQSLKSPIIDQSDHIILDKVSYGYLKKPSNLTKYNTSQLVISQLSMTIQSGQMVAIGGGPSVGKTCILKLIARLFQPINEKGFIHYPVNWRVRYIDSYPNFFGGNDTNVQMYNEMKDGGGVGSMRGTLDYNLKFGCDFSHPNEDIFDLEIYELLKELGLSKQLIGDTFYEYSKGVSHKEEVKEGTHGMQDVHYGKKYTQIGLNGDKLSKTDRSLLSIACALLSSVDLLIIQNVFDGLGPQHGCDVFFILKKFIENRGLPNILKTETNRIPFHLRKKKTIIFSTKVKSLLKMADNWLLVTRTDKESTILMSPTK